jgi:hypothetical protein
VLVLFGTDFNRLRGRYAAIAAELEATMQRRLRRP